MIYVMHYMKWKIILFIVLAALAAGAGLSYLPGVIDNNSSAKNSPISAVSLDLSTQNLKSVPSYVFNERGLKELDVSYNQLTGALPSQINQLKNLRKLDASHNKMTGVPAEVGQLDNLEELDLSYNQLTGLPQELGNLKNLKILNISGNNYSRQDLKYIEDRLPKTTVIVK